jgi:hypothetical protein
MWISWDEPYSDWISSDFWNDLMLTKNHRFVHKYNEVYDEDKLSWLLIMIIF